MFNIFTFLREHKVYAHIRAAILELLAPHEEELKAKAKEIKEELKAKIEDYIKEKSPEAKEKLIDLIMNNIPLKFPYNLFKGIIRKTIDKNFDKLIQFILMKLQEI